jgi:hypothetical protein
LPCQSIALVFYSESFAVFLIDKIKSRVDEKEFEVAIDAERCD